MLTYSQAKSAIDAVGRDELEDLLETFNDQPHWLESMGGIDLEDVQPVIQGGCASGAFMPAVTYHQASETMRTNGNDILEYIEDQLGEIPQPNKGETWSGMAVFYCSMAVELWCGQFDELVESIDW